MYTELQRLAVSTAAKTATNIDTTVLKCGGRHPQRLCLCTVDADNTTTTSA